MQNQQEEFRAPGEFVESLFDASNLHKNELAAETVRSSGELRLRVTGSSMLPAIRPADELLIRRCCIEEADTGDAVLFIRQRRLFAHRVIGRSGTSLLTQGDGIAEPDPPVRSLELLGKVVLVTRRGKIFRLRSKPSLPGRMASALFRRSATAGRLFSRLQGLQLRTVP